MRDSLHPEAVYAVLGDMDSTNALSRLDGAQVVDLTGIPTVTVELRKAAVGPVIAWNRSQQLRALHESSHACTACLITNGGPKVRLKGIDLKGRHGAYTVLGTDDDDQDQFRTVEQLRSQLIVAMAGREGERVHLGTMTDGGMSDISEATRLACLMWDAGLLPSQPIVDFDGLSHYSPPQEIMARRAEAVIAAIADAQREAARIVEAHADVIARVAARLFAARRINDEPLLELLRSEGLEPLDLGE